MDTNYSFDETFTIIPDLLDNLRGRLEKANRKATKLGIGGYELIVGEPSIRIVREPLDPEMAEFSRPGSYIEHRIPVIEVTVRGNMPTLPGYSFVATLEHLDGGTVVRRMPLFHDEEIAVPTDLDPKRCDHCGKRRKRLRTFLLAGWLEGRFVIVGNECMKSYLGDMTAENAAHYLSGVSFLEDLRTGLAPTPGTSHWIITEDYMPAVAAAMRVQGEYVTAAAAENFNRKESSARSVSTGRLARHTMLQEQTRKEALARGTAFTPDCLVPEVTEADRTKAAGFFAWIAGVTPRNEFQSNMKAAGLSRIIDAKSAAILAYGIAAYEKDFVRVQVEKKRIEAGQVSQHVGEIGKRLRLQLTIDFCKTLESQYGGYDKYLYKFVDETGNVFAWFASSPISVQDSQGRWERNAGVGDVVVVKATIKKHDDYKGTKQTILTRGTVEAVQAPVASAQACA